MSLLLLFIQPDTTPPIISSPDAPQGGSGGGGRGGGAKWERSTGQSGPEYGALSVKEQNEKERREILAIEREIERQEQITAQKAALEALEQAELKEIKALTTEAGVEAGKITAMAAAFERAGLIAPVAVDPFDEEEEEILMLLAALH